MANLEVVSAEAEVKVDPKEAKRLARQQEKQEAKRKAYAKGMITRVEAFQIAQQAAKEAVDSFAEFIREPLRANLVQSMALTEMMMDKGIIVDADEFQAYLNKIQERLDKSAEVDANASEENNGDPVTEETQE